MRRVWIFVAAVACASLAGCGGSSETPATTTSAQVDAGCLPADQQPSAGDKPQFDRPKKVLTGGPARLVMTTSCGVITIVLNPRLGGPIPNSVAFLAQEGFYDGLTFHRVVENFVLQGGDPNEDGSGGPGYEVVGPVPAGYRYRVGDVAMAKTPQAPPGTAGSQFYVISAEAGAEFLSTTRSDGILGRATGTESLATIQRIAALAIPGEQFSPPSQPVWIESMRLEQG